MKLFYDTMIKPLNDKLGEDLANRKIVIDGDTAYVALKDKEDVNVTWHHEDEGEIVTLEVWNGNGWNVLGLDADFTIEETMEMLQDFYDRNEFDEECIEKEVDQGFYDNDPSNER